MIRRDVYRNVGGMNEQVLAGMEDWDFWVKCAANGYWGDTVPEFLDWYRRRANHADRWADWDGGERMRQFRESLRLRYPAVFHNGIPRPAESVAAPSAAVRRAPAVNRLKNRAGVRRLLMIVPHLEIGGADKFNLDLAGILGREFGYEITVAATGGGSHPWRPYFQALTPDVFTLDTFLARADRQEFIEYLMGSRDYDAVLVSNSEFGYRLLPFLRAKFARPVFADYVHMESEDWKSGGFPRYSLDYAPFLDFTVTASAHLKNWMTARGGDPGRIFVRTINVDAELWDRGRYRPHEVRARYGVAPGVPVIVYAARLCGQKRPEVLAEVARRLKRRGAAFVCLVAGDGPDRETLESFVRDNRLRELRMLGARTNEEVREILSIADIYFMPSRMEGIAMAIYEAMSMGAVPVSADVGGQSELVVPECGVLVKPGPGEVEAYADALTGLLADPAKRLDMARRCRERVCASFPLREMGVGMAELLETQARRRDGPTVLQLRGADSLAGEEEISARWSSPAVDEEYDAMLALAARVFRGNLFALPELVRRSGLTVRGMLRTAALAASPRHPARNAGNLVLLSRTLANRQARARLLANFDARFYREEYGDVHSAGVVPLLHYCLIGHVENRRPSRRFDAAGVLRRNPAIRGRGVNPLLWDAWLARTPDSGSGQAG